MVMWCQMYLILIKPKNRKLCQTKQSNNA
jgi:hypothetical protein